MHLHTCEPLHACCSRSFRSIPETADAENDQPFTEKRDFQNRYGGKPSFAKIHITQKGMHTLKSTHRHNYAHGKHWNKGTIDIP